MSSVKRSTKIHFMLKNEELNLRDLQKFQGSNKLNQIEKQCKSKEVKLQKFFATPGETFGDVNLEERQQMREISV